MNTHAILDAYTDEPIVIGVDELAHILSSITDAVTTAVYPHEDW